MSWNQSYAQKTKSADEAVALIQSGQRIFCSGNAAPPRALIEALARRAESLESVTVHHLFDTLGILSAPEMAPHFRCSPLFCGPADRRPVQEGRADYTPIFLHHIPRLFEEGILELDVTLATVSPPDRHGFMSFGSEVLATPAAARAAKRVIVQVNRQMPRIHGDCQIHVDEVDAIVEADSPRFIIPDRTPSPLEQRIGAHIRPLIPCGATLQMGIGGVPDAVFSTLDDCKDLGIHSEMFSDGAMRAIQRGIVTGRRKTLHPGKAVITFAMGSDELYDWVDDNPVIEARPVDYVNDPFIIARNDRMISINSAIEVDITGQVCSDSIGARPYSGFGGQVDFVRGAAASRGGRAIIALSALARGDMSRIVGALKPGAGVVTSRADVDCIVTEYGVAELFGKNLRQRAEALIAIAHPEHRQALEEAAKARRIFT